MTCRIFTTTLLKFNPSPSKFSRLSQCPTKISATINRSYSSTEDQRLWIRSPNPDIVTVTGKTAPEFMWDVARQWGSATAFECAITGRKYSFDDLYTYSRGFGASLIKQGVPRGSTVSIVLPNIPEYPIALYGSLEAGLVVSTINPGYTPHEIIRQVINSETKVVITMDLFLPSVLKARESCPDLKTIIVVGQPVEQCHSFFEMMKTDPTGYDFLKGSEIDVTTTTAMLPYSSGTTGPPKGVELTHSGLASNVVQHVAPLVGSATSFSCGVQERLIGLLPFFHVAGFHGYLFYGVHNGCHTMCLPKFEPQLYAQTIKKHKPTILQLVPPLMNFVSQSPDITREDLKQVHSIIAGAATIGQSLIRQMLQKFGENTLWQEGFGMTEMSGMILLLQTNTKNSKIGSTGTAMPSTICKVIDLTTGESLGPNQRGELCLKGPQMMKGYFKNPEATRNTIDSNGWLHTGDICYYDEEQYFYIVDRLKELIKVKGFQVAPSELEDLLREHKDVLDVAVIGVPDEERGEVPRAYIVTRNKELTEENIQDFVLDKVIEYKRLKGGVEFVDAIKKAPSGKILRRELLADFKAK